MGPDAQSQELKAAFEKHMDALCEHLQFTAANGERARHDPLASSRDALIPRYQAALDEVDPADAAKAKGSIDKLLGDAEALGKEIAAFRSEAEKAAAEWQSRVGAYDAAVVQVEELQAWPHPKEEAVRGLADGIRTHVNERAHAKAIAVLDQFLPKLQTVYEDYQKQKAAQQQYEPALAALQPRLGPATQPPPFNKLAPKQAEITSAQSAMEASAQGRDFVTALEQVEKKPDPPDPNKPPKEKVDSVVEATLEYTIIKNKQKLGTGTTKVGIAIGAKGTLDKVELDVTGIKEKIKFTGVSGKAIEIQFKLSVHTKVDLTEEELSKAVKTTLKAEIEASMPGVPVLEHVKPVITGKAGQGGFTVGFGIEITLPDGAPPKAQRQPRVPISVTVEARKGDPIVPGDNPHDMHLDDECIEIRAKTPTGHGEICRRLIAAIPDLEEEGGIEFEF